MFNFVFDWNGGVIFDFHLKKCPELFLDGVNCVNGHPEIENCNYPGPLYGNLRNPFFCILTLSSSLVSEGFTCLKNTKMSETSKLI